MSNALLEAMVVGLPCVASDIPSNRELITPGQNGLLVDVEDARAFAAAMGLLLTDRMLRHVIGLEARATIRRRFTVQTMIEANQNLYIALARQRRNA
jgi:glycosyltransferase involved in cell wall biosynthesis